MKRIFYLCLSLAGSGIVTVFVLGVIPIALVTHSSWGLFGGLVGVIIGGIISADGCEKFFYI